MQYTLIFSHAPRLSTIFTVFTATEVRQWSEKAEDDRQWQRLFEYMLAKVEALEQELTA